MNALSRLWEKLGRSKKYREGFAASVVKRMIPLQIRVLRKQRDWSQARLANESKLTQGVISRAEDPDYGNLTVNTLVRIGAGFDCAFIGRFVPFSDLARWYTDLGNEKSLEVASFDTDTGFIEKKPLALATSYGSYLHNISDMHWERGPGDDTFAMTTATHAPDSVAFRSGNENYSKVWYMTGAQASYPPTGSDQAR